MRLPYIDLSQPRRIADYDKSGGALLLDRVKHYLFGDSGHRMTAKRCADFFDNEDNFGK